MSQANLKKGYGLTIQVTSLSGLQKWLIIVAGMAAWFWSICAHVVVEVATTPKLYQGFSDQQLHTRLKETQMLLDIFSQCMTTGLTFSRSVHRSPTEPTTYRLTQSQSSTSGCLPSPLPSPSSMIPRYVSGWGLAVYSSMCGIHTLCEIMS